MSGAGKTATSHPNLTIRRRLPDGTWNGLLCSTLMLSRQLEAEMDQALAVVPLSARGLVTLLEVEKEPNPTQAHLSQRLALGPGTTSEMLRRLERRGLVRRNPARRGGRRPQTPGTLQAVTLTEAGRAALTEAVGIAANVEDDWARRLGGTGESTLPGLRAYGLRRWLALSLAALRLRASAR